MRRPPQGWTSRQPTSPPGRRRGSGHGRTAPRPAAGAETRKRPPGRRASCGQRLCAKWPLLLSCRGRAGARATPRRPGCSAGHSVKAAAIPPLTARAESHGPEMHLLTGRMMWASASSVMRTSGPASADSGLLWAVPRHAMMPPTAGLTVKRQLVRASPPPRASRAGGPRAARSDGTGSPGNDCPQRGRDSSSRGGGCGPVPGRVYQRPTLSWGIHAHWGCVSTRLADCSVAA